MQNKYKNNLKMANKLNRRQSMKIFNFLECKGQMFVFGIIVLILLTSGIGVVESRAELQEGVLEDMDEDALWESAQKKCKILNKEPEFNQDEYLIYLKKVEEANPNADWKKIIAALHYSEFGVDIDGTLPVPIISLPLFKHGDETLGYKNVDLVCRIGTTTNYNPPKYVYNKNCQKIDIAHSYAGPRSDLNRGNSIGDLFGLWPWFMRRANTNWGDTWQSAYRGRWDPPDQFAGDDMGLWLSDYYRKSENQNTPLSSAYKDYFDSSSGKWACNNEEVCKGAGYYWYDDQCYEEPEYKKEKKCDVSHLNLCDNKYDCEKLGKGYWYYGYCHMDPEKDTSNGGTSAGDTSNGEFSCPTPIPKGAKHIVTDYEDYWVMLGHYPVSYNAVGLYQRWYDKEKTKKRNFACHNTEGKNGVSKSWYEDGTPQWEGNYKDGNLHGVQKFWGKDGAVAVYTWENGKQVY